MTFGVSTISRTQVQLWYNRCKIGREDASMNITGSPSMSTTDENIEAVKKMILDNLCITIREVAHHVGILYGSCHAIFSYVLGMNRAAANMFHNCYILSKDNVAWT